VSAVASGASRPPVLDAIPRRGHVVIEASAGTGKTYTLEHLVVDLLLTDRVEVDRILVVTFTEKGTEELRERVRSQLRRLAAAPPLAASDAGGAESGAGWLLDDAARQALADAAVRFDAATISTIHGFCQRVLTEHSFAHRRLFEQRLVDGREMVARGFRTVIGRQLGARGALREQLLAWLRQGNDLGRLEKLVAEAVRQRGVLTPRWDPAALAAAARAFLDACDDELLGRALDAAGSSTQRRGERDPRPLIATLATANEADSLGEQLREWGRRKVTVDGKEDRLWSLLRRGLGRLARTDVAAARAGAALDTLRDGMAPPLAALVGGLREAVAEWLQVQKHGSGLYDFDDMLLHVREALCGPSADAALVAALRGRWHVALIDEFQDTDEVQWDIFRTLFVEGEAAIDGGSARRLFLIGDPKQAIYGFRNADVHTYLAARRAVVDGGGTQVALLDNYRSTPPLIAACNRIFESGFFSGDLADFQPARPGGETRVARDAAGADLDPVVVVCLRSEGKPPRRIGDARAALAAWIPEEARRLVEERVTFGVEGDERPLEYRDLMVLARRGAETREVAEALRRAGVPHVLYGQEGLLATPEAVHVRRVLQAVAAPADGSARLLALLTPFFAVPLGQLAACRELAETHPLASRLLEWAALAEARRYAELFRSVLRDTGLVRRLLATRQGERELTNYQHVFDLLLEETARAPAPLGELVARLGSWIAGTSGPPGFDRDVQRLEPVRNAVQVLTMHRAKGLEAPVVFIAGPSGTPSQSELLRVYHLDGERRLHLGRDPVGEVAAAIDAEETEEIERLYYVALTRARARLYLPDAANKRSRWHRVEERLVKLVAARTPGFVVTEVECAAEDEASARTGLAWRPDRALLEVPAEPSLLPLRRRHAGRLLTSYTRMRRFAAAAAAEEAAVVADVASEAPAAPLLPLSPGELPGGRGTGIFLHRLLEKVDPGSLRAAVDAESWLADAEVQRVLGEVVDEQGADERSLPAAYRLVWNALRTPLLVDGLELPVGLCEAERRAVEMELVFPIPEAAHPRLGEAPAEDAEAPFRAGRGFVQGVVDLVFEHGGRTYFVDWKSDRLAAWDDEAIRRHVAEHYALQAQLYALGVLRLLGLRGEEDHERRFGGLLYCFLRGMGDPKNNQSGAGVHFARPSWQQLRGWEDELRERTNWGAS
jgi:exodeoxyribonuclease V beta subunit